MKPGTFSLNLAVKDLSASLAFYEKLDFSVVFGEPSQNWLVLRNEETTMGMFEINN